MTGYVRVDTSNNIADGNVISAADLDNEFDGVQAGFNASTGHTHGGAAGEGAPITKIGPTQDVTASASLLAPKTTNTVDIGSALLKFKDLYLAGVATLGAGAVLNTPASVTLTNATGLPVATGISGLGTGVATFLATPSSANLAAAITDETGTGALVFANSPTLVTPALGTPASGVVTNLTGTASININGTVGATTATTGAFTTLAASGAVTLSGGTANGVTYLNGSKVLTTGSALTFDGTTSLALKQGTGGLGNYSELVLDITNSFSGSGKSYLRNISLNGGNSSTALAFGVNADGGGAPSEQMRLTSTGLTVNSLTANGVVYANGSKTLTSGSALTFDGTNINVTNGVLTSQSATGGNGYVGAIGTGMRLVNLHASSDIDFIGNGGINLSTAGNFPFKFSIAGSEQMRLTSTGLGIGTSSPASRLDVTQATSDTANGLTLRGYTTGSDGGRTFNINTVSSDLNSWANLNFKAQQFTFSIQGTEKMRLDSSGNLLIGTTITPGNSGSVGLRKGGTGELILVANNGGLFHQAVSSYYLVTTAGGNTSDATLKKNVRQLSGALEKVCAIRGVNFEFIAEQKSTPDNGVQVGVIAQEVEAQYPEIVVTNEEGIKSVRYEKLVAPLIEAIKEQQTIIESLKARLDAANL